MAAAWPGEHVRISPKKGCCSGPRAVSNHTTPAIASILSGLLPEHHGIFDKAGAKESSILSLPEMASASGLKAAVIMEKNGAEVYQGLIEIVEGIPDSIPPEDFDREVLPQDRSGHLTEAQASCHLLHRHR